MNTPLQAASRVGWSDERLQALRRVCRLAGIAEVEFSFIGHAEVPIHHFTNRGPVPTERKWVQVTFAWTPGTDQWRCRQSSHIHFYSPPRPPVDLLASARLVTDVPGGDW